MVVNVSIAPLHKMETKQNSPAINMASFHHCQHGYVFTHVPLSVVVGWLAGLGQNGQCNFIKNATMQYCRSVIENVVVG